MFGKKLKPINKLVVQTNKLIFLGCPCSTQADGSCINSCCKVNTKDHPCVTCPISSLVYIAIAIKKEVLNNEMVVLNMQKPITLSMDMFPGKEV
jgi:hypothetical protein